MVITKEEDRVCKRVGRWEGQRHRLALPGGQPIAEQRTHATGRAHSSPSVSGYTRSDRAMVSLLPPSKIYGHSSRSGTKRKARRRDTALTGLTLASTKLER